MLRHELPAQGMVLEIASGSGEHIVHFAQALPGLTFQPTDPDEDAVRSIAAWIATSGTANVKPPLALDVMVPWPVAKADAVLCINMIHIAPWPATGALLRGAASVLASGGLLYLYGPYRRNGAHTATSNEDFDRSLKARNAAWGVRDLDDVAAAGETAGFGVPVIHEMPANNLSLVFRRR